MKRHLLAVWTTVHAVALVAGCYLLWGVLGAALPRSGSLGAVRAWSQTHTLWPLAVGIALALVTFSGGRRDALRAQRAAGVSPLQRQMLLYSSSVVKVGQDTNFGDLAEKLYRDRTYWVYLWVVNAGSRVAPFRRIRDPHQTLRQGWKVLVPAAPLHFSGAQVEDVCKRIAEQCRQAVLRGSADLITEWTKAVVAAEKAMPGIYPELLRPERVGWILGTVIDGLQAAPAPAAAAPSAPRRS